MKGTNLFRFLSNLEFVFAVAPGGFGIFFPQVWCWHLASCIGIGNGIGFALALALARMCIILSSITNETGTGWLAIRILINITTKMTHQCKIKRKKGTRKQPKSKSHSHWRTTNNLLALNRLPQCPPDRAASAGLTRSEAPPLRTMPTKTCRSAVGLAST